MHNSRTSRPLAWSDEVVCEEGKRTVAEAANWLDNL